MDESQGMSLDVTWRSLLFGDFHSLFDNDIILSFDVFIQGEEVLGLGLRRADRAAMSTSSCCVRGISYKN